MIRVPVVGEVGRRLQRRLERIRERRLDPTPIGADVYERPNAYTVVMDAPGVSQDDVQVRYVGGQVMTRLERFRDPYDGFDLSASGRRLAFEQEVPLPEDGLVTPEAGEATLRTDGTLHIDIPKVDAAVEEETTTHVIE